MKTRDWTMGTRYADELLITPSTTQPGASVSEGTKLLLSALRRKKLAESTITSYTGLLTAFQEHCARRGITALSALRLIDFETFMDGRPTESPNTQRKEISNLRRFCSYWLNHRWISENFAKHLDTPKDRGAITMPYTKEEIGFLIAACDQITCFNGPSAARARLRARALILLMLYSGMRVSDAVRLKRSSLDADGKVMMRTMKTGVPLYVKLHADAVQALLSLPPEGDYFLWSGKSRLATATGSARRTVECISRISGIPARPHRFRDTFAVDLLSKGVDIRTVQLLLGHDSVRTTERHYAPYVASFQTLLDSATSKLQFGPSSVRGRAPQRSTEFEEKSSSASSN